MQNEDLRIRVEPATVRLQVEARLRAAIASGFFKPGQRLIERELCELIGVGRTSIREAMRQLEAEELIVTVPHRGPTVCRIGIEEAQQLYEARGLIEGFAARKLAMSRSPDDLKALKVATEAVVAGSRKRDRQVLVAAKAAFYDALMRGCGNPLLEAALRRYRHRIDLLRITSMSPPGRIADSISEIQAIYDAVAAGNPAAADEACRRHLANASTAALAVLTSNDRLEVEGIPR